MDKKHSVPFPGLDLETHIEWTEFYRADALIVSGRMTGSAPPLDKVRRAKEAATRPILMGSGTTAENIADFLQYADGAIVGSSLKVDGREREPGGSLSGCGATWLRSRPCEKARLTRILAVVRAPNSGQSEKLPPRRLWRELLCQCRQRPCRV